MKKKLIIIVGIVVLLIAGVCFGLSNGLSEGAKASVSGIDLSDIPDGSYTGTYNFKRWSNTLVVHVKNHAITSVDIEKDITFAIPDCADEIFNRVIEKQDTRVDAVSGATVTSKAYLKAIEDALEAGND